MDTELTKPLVDNFAKFKRERKEWEFYFIQIIKKKR